MKTRVITAIGILACVIPPLLLGGWLLNLLIAFIIIAGGIELLGLSEHKDHWPAVVLPLAIICVFVLTFCTESLVLPLLGVFMLGMLSIPVFSEKFPAKDSFHCIGYIALFALIARSFLYIYEKDAMFIWYIIIATYVCDTAAYLCGRFFGKHKLNPRVSPKKTWEGSIGGWFFWSSSVFCLCMFMYRQCIGYWDAVCQYDFNNYRTDRRFSIQCYQTFLWNQRFFKFTARTWRCIGSCRFSCI